jgi:PKD repeat protein
VAAGSRHRSWRGIGILCGGLAAPLALAPAEALAQPPLFAFAQFSDVQANDPIETQRLEDVLDAIAAAGLPGALLPHPVSVVFIAGDLVNTPGSQSEWVQFRNEIEQGLTDDGIPFLAVPGNHDQDEFGTPKYEQFIASPGVWDASSAGLVGHNGIEISTGWEGLRFVGVNNSWAGGNTVRPADLLQLGPIVAAAAGSGESVFIVTHHPHDDEGKAPLAGLLETPGVVGYLRGHKGTPHATQGLAGIANPVWDLSSESVMRDAALIYYEVFSSEIRAYVLKLVDHPVSLPTPSVLTLAQPLWPAAAPAQPVAAFAALPPVGRAPLEVAFVDLSAGHPTSWLWDLGDGTSSMERHPIHVYPDGGSYDVTLAVGNAQGADATTQYAAVELLPPLPSVTFTAVADARVSSGSPTQNFGSSSTVRARLAPSTTDQSYLRFAVGGLGDLHVSRAVLRLYVTDPSVEGGKITLAPGGWSESTLTWSNAPGIGSLVLASVGTVFPDSWVEFDVSAVVTGPGSYDFGLSNGSSNSAIYSSREGGHPPELVVYTATTVPTLGPLAMALLIGALAVAGSSALPRRASTSGDVVGLEV